MLSWILLIIYVVNSAIGMVLIKKGGANSNFTVGKGNLQLQISWIVLLGIAFYFVSFILWIFILQLFNLTYISPLAYGISYIFITVFSRIILHENIRKEQLAGAFLIVLGILIASYKKN